MSGLDMGDPSKAPWVKDMEAELRLEAMVEWFHQNFEDPAENTPYETAEGGYQWIWGGPYDAREELESAFAGDATDDEIMAAVEEVEGDGIVNWAPSSSRLFEEPDEPENGDESVLLQSELDELAERLAQLQNQVSYWQGIQPGIGHNRAPTYFWISPDDDQLVEVSAGIVEVQTELDKPDAQDEADVSVLERASGRFLKLAAHIAKVVGIAAVAVIGVVYTGAGNAAGEELWKDPHAFYQHLILISGTLLKWAHHISTGY